jgi:hypothetical protein
MGYFRNRVIQVAVQDDKEKIQWSIQLNADPNDYQVSRAKAQAEVYFREHATRPRTMLGGTGWSIVTTYQDKEDGKITTAYGKPTGYSV